MKIDLVRFALRLQLAEGSASRGLLSFAREIYVRSDQRLGIGTRGIIVQRQVHLFCVLIVFSPDLQNTALIQLSCFKGGEERAESIPGSAGFGTSAYVHDFISATRGL